MSKFVNIIRSGYNYGQRKIGVELGPKYLCQHNTFNELLQRHNVQHWSNSTNRAPNNKCIEHIENERVINPKLLMNLVAISNRKLYDFNILTPKMFRLNLVGDHSGVIGSVAASSKLNNNLVLVWIDAHTDINTPDTSLTGKIGRAHV